MTRDDEIKLLQHVAEIHATVQTLPSCKNCGCTKTGWSIRQQAVAGTGFFGAVAAIVWQITDKISGGK